MPDRRAGDQFYRTEFRNTRRKEQWQIDALAMKVAVAFGVNLCDVTPVGVLDQQEGEDLWLTAAESGGTASCEQSAVEDRRWWKY
jgi:hypothetical protein